MPKAESSNSKDSNPTFGKARNSPHWLAALLWLIAALLLTVALVDFIPEQSKLNTTAPTSHNLVGDLGANSSWISYRWIGGATWLVPIFCYWMTYIYLRSARRLAVMRLLAMGCCIASFCTLAAMQTTVFTDRSVFTAGPGGLLGQKLYDGALDGFLGIFGTALIMGTVYLVGMVFIFTHDIGIEFGKLIQGFHEWRKQRAEQKTALFDERRKQSEKAEKEKAAAAVLAAKAAAAAQAAAAFKKPTGPEPTVAITPSLSKASVTPTPAAKPTAEPPAGKTATDPKQLAVATGRMELNIVKPEETKKARVTLPQSDDKTYEFPPLKLLK